MMNREERILRLWRDVEAMDIPDIPARDKKHGVQLIRDDRPLPWETDEFVSTDTQTWRHAIFLGKIDKASAIARISSQFSSKTKENDALNAQAVSGDGLSAVMVVDENGAVLTDDFQIASFVAAVHKLHQSDDLSELDAMLSKLKLEFQDRMASSDAGVTSSSEAPAQPTDPEQAQTDRIIGWEDIFAEEEELRKLAPSLYEEWEGSTIIRSTQISRAAASTQPAFMNSFYLNDLDRLISQATTGDSFQGALSSFIGEIPPERRDILSDKDAFRELLDPKFLTSARWPENPEYALSLGQQAAVGAICRMMDSDDTLVAVNGPPGTGKTTLLRDVFAEIITRRARGMARVTKPKFLFVKTVPLGDKNFHKLAPDIFGSSGIVVTSNNNAAVENISFELPDAASIDHEAFPDADYFGQAATAILSTRDTGSEGQSSTKDGWAAISARLGKKGNIEDFLNAWFNDKKPREGELRTDFKALLDDRNADFPTWEDARNRFLELDKQVERRREEFERAYEVIQRRQNLAHQRDQLRHEFTIAEKASESIKHIPDDAFLSRSEDDRQKGSVWVDPEFDKLRSELFLAALDLHRAFLYDQKSKILPSLRLFINMMKGNIKEISDENAQDLWNIFFTAVPVVSTSLASLPRMFSKFGDADIPWLFIDESGQATPGATAGAIWRARKAVIVGDPQQIPPVFTVPPVIVDKLVAHHKLDNRWSPAVQSAQTLADQAMTMGAWIGDPEAGGVWGGLPLRAHRRCAEPMFSISNDLAYNGQMVQAGASERKSSYFMGPSAWIDIVSAKHEDKIALGELELMREVVRHAMRWNAQLKSEGLPTQNIYIISPFRVISDALKKIIKKENADALVKAGTVHTFQGMEAPIVYVVLGTRPGKDGAGSRSWAGSSPNLLNVAATRAKDRIYFVGSLKDWETVSGFDLVAQNMKDAGNVISYNGDLWDVDRSQWENHKQSFAIP